MLAELSVEDAIAEAPGSAADLLRRAASAESSGDEPPTILRSFTAPARAHTYHLHVAVPGVARDLLEPLVDLFASAARLERQPWYAGFLSGSMAPVPGASGEHQLAVVRIDAGLGKPRGYVQLTSCFREVERAAIVLRSVRGVAPPGCVPAHTLAPSGDVLSWVDGALHWHHVMTVRGVGLLPGALDGAFMRLLRGAGLDGAERRAYLEEARAFAAWVKDPAAVRALRARL